VGVLRQNDNVLKCQSENVLLMTVLYCLFQLRGQDGERGHYHGKSEGTETITALLGKAGHFHKPISG